ncbi:MAG: PilZ domain-containing protein [Deltaproteobacteria bacterium]|nr:PilZ domain-containing protein [Deltaproteobacteria bacterium]
MPTERRGAGRDRRDTPKTTKAKSRKVVPDRTELRRRERRMGDRRESPRLPIKVWVKNSASNTFEQVEGDISVGGLHFVDKLPITGKQIDLRFKLPGRTEEVRVHGEVIQVSQKKAGGYGAHVKFADLDLDTQLAIARFIDERS